MRRAQPACTNLRLPLVSCIVISPFVDHTALVLSREGDCQGIDARHEIHPTIVSDVLIIAQIDCSRLGDAIKLFLHLTLLFLLFTELCSAFSFSIVFGKRNAAPSLSCSSFRTLDTYCLFIVLPRRDSVI